MHSGWVDLARAEWNKSVSLPIIVITDGFEVSLIVGYFEILFNFKIFCGML